MSWRKTCTSNPNKLHIQYHPTRSTCHKAALTGKKTNTVSRHGRFQHLEAFQNKFPARPDHAENTRGISDLLSRVDPGDVRWPKRHHENFHLPVPSPRWRRGGGQRRSPCRPRNHSHQRPLFLSLYVCPYVSSCRDSISSLFQVDPTAPCHISFTLKRTSHDGVMPQDRYYVLYFNPTPYPTKLPAAIPTLA